jgi:two-component system LytT family sensor kinase
MDQRLILVTLLIKLGVAAAIGSALVRSKIFKSMLFREERTRAESFYLVLFAGFPFALGVMVRGSVHNFLAADLAFEASILIGVIGGRFAGIMAGVLMSLPSALHGEIINLPFNVFSGLVAGVLRQLTTDHETIWSFSPFIDLSIYRWIRRNLKRPQIDWQIGFFLVIVILSFLRIHLARAFPQYIFSLDSNQWAVYIAIYATNAMCIAIPLKIFHNARIELKLEEQARMLLEARMEALQSQINPHFLFNTLNTVSSLVRFDPDGARELIVKLANILRRLMRKTDVHFVPLREEIDFIDDYLDIEVVRFGRDKLRVVKELDPESLETLVPSMVLQPLVENSIKHGLSRKVGGGSIHLRSRMQDSTLFIEVEDDGVGMAAASVLEARTVIGGGIGMTNVIERLHVLYGNAAALSIQSPEEGGTLVTVRIPALESLEAQTARQLASST